MDITIYPRPLYGTVPAIPSKSLLHRYLICAAVSNQQTSLNCNISCEDIAATADCLRALGAKIIQTQTGLTVLPIHELPVRTVLNCRESATTLRLLLPVVSALGIDATFLLSGHLRNRPLSPLLEEMEHMGARLDRIDERAIHCTGALLPGDYNIDGNVSSQFISGLMLAQALMPGTSTLNVSGRLESAPYVNMTECVLREFGIERKGNSVSGRFPFQSPGSCTVEGDWSNSAFFLAANTMGSQISVEGLQENSTQGDCSVLTYLSQLACPCSIDLSQNPDLFPILAVVAAAHSGAVFTGLHRLRYKESDRIDSVSRMLSAFGISFDTTDESMSVYPGDFHGCFVDSCRDHRIAMAAAIAASTADGPVTVRNADCVTKSYPTFWEEYRKLGGIYEHQIR